MAGIVNRSNPIGDGRNSQKPGSFTWREFTLMFSENSEISSQQIQSQTRKEMNPDVERASHCVPSGCAA
jgi:hypothetical protein